MSSRGSSPRHLALVDETADLTGLELLAAAQSAHDEAEREFDRSLDTRAVLKGMYLRAALSLEAERHPALGIAWLGLATVRRYQKGRREDALEAFDSALTASPDDLDIWDAYLDYITYAASAASLMGIVERMPAAVRVEKLWLVMSVGSGTDRWGTMSLEDQKTFTAELPVISSTGRRRPAARRSQRKGVHPGGPSRSRPRRQLHSGHQVDPAVARALHVDLSAGLVSFDAQVTGLALWRYDGGPWDPGPRSAFRWPAGSAPGG